MGISLHVSVQGVACREVNGIVSVVGVAALKLKEALLFQSVAHNGAQDWSDLYYPHFAVWLKHRDFALAGYTRS
jgi:hypothetical protein